MPHMAKSCLYFNYVRTVPEARPMDIPRQIQHLEPIEITEEELLSWERQSGGFGSTGK